MAQSVKLPRLDFGSGYDLGVIRLSPILGSVLSGACMGFLLSLFVYLPPLGMLSFERKKDRKTERKKGINKEQLSPFLMNEIKAGLIPL